MISILKGYLFGGDSISTTKNFKGNADTKELNLARLRKEREKLQEKKLEAFGDLQFVFY